MICLKARTVRQKFVPTWLCVSCDFLVIACECQLI